MELSPAAVAYDREVVPWLFDPWVKPFIDLAAPTTTSGILDLACGSGLLARHLVKRLDEDGRISAVDADAAMLSYAATTSDDHRISWYESDATRLPFNSDAFDLAYCHHGLQFFPDPEAALREVRRVLRPKGRVAIAVWGPIEDNPWLAALSDAVRALLGDAAGDTMSVVSRLGNPEDLAEVLRGGGLADVTAEVRVRTATHPDAARAVSGQLLALSLHLLRTVNPDESRLAEVAAKMCELLTDHIGPNGDLSLPSTCAVAVGTNA